MSTASPRHALTVTTASTPWSRELELLLTDERLDHSQALEALHSSPLRVEALMLRDAIRERAAPASDQVIVTTLLPLVSLYGVGKKSDAEWAAFWGFYIEALGDLPREAIEGGVRDFVADAKSEWFPKPGPLRALCLVRARPALMAWGRVRKLVAI